MVVSSAFACTASRETCSFCDTNFTSRIFDPEIKSSVHGIKSIFSLHDISYEKFSHCMMFLQRGSAIADKWISVQNIVRWLENGKSGSLRATVEITVGRCWV